MHIIYVFKPLQIIWQLRWGWGNISHEINMDVLWYICTNVLYWFQNQ